MATTEIIVPFLRGTTSQNNAYKGRSGEVTIDVTKTTLRVHDGIRLGGNEMLTRDMADDVVENTEAAEAAAASALASKNAAATSAGQANSSKVAAAASAAAAQVSETGAVGSAATATTKAADAADRAVVATTAATTATTAQAAVVAALDSFRSVYLGEFATDPTTDSHGNPILDGAQYRNTVTGKLRVYRTETHTWRDYSDDEEAALLSAQLAAAAAASSQGAALTSEVHAAQSEVAAAQSETNAAASQAAALASKNAAGISETNAATSEANADTFEAAALASKNAAGISETNAATSEASALASKNAAATSKTGADASALAAEDSAEKAQAWAALPEGEVVETGLYSSLHYATKSKEQADRAQFISDAVEQANVDAVSVHNDRLHVDVVMDEVAAASQIASDSSISASSSKQTALDAAASALGYRNQAQQSKEEALTSENAAFNSKESAALSAANTADLAVVVDAFRATAQQAASNASASEANTADMEEAATASKNAAQIAAQTSVNALASFRAHWYGALTANPIINPNGDPVAEGDSYWNITLDAMFVYDGSNWLNPLATNAVNVISVAANGITETTVQGAINQIGEAINGLGTAAKKNTGTGTDNVILGNDARLTDSRAIKLSAMMGQVPIWDGTTWTAGVIIPGLMNFSEDVSSTGAAGPGTGVKTVNLAPAATDGNVSIALAVKGAGSFTLQVPDGVSVANGFPRGQYAVDFQRSRTSNVQVAQAMYSTILNGQNNRILSTADGSAILSGNSGYLAGKYSVIVSGLNNRINLVSENSVICGGRNHTVTGVNSGIVGGIQNTANGAQSFIGGGESNGASGIDSAVAGGSSNSVEGQFSACPGGSGAFDRAVFGALVWGGGVGVSGGTLQRGNYLLTGLATSTTAVLLSTDGQTYGNVDFPNYMKMSANSAYKCVIHAIAKDLTTNAALAMTGNCVITRGAAEANTAVSTVTWTSNGTSGAISLSNPVVTADTTLGCLKISVVGLASRSIQWLVHVETLEIQS